MICKQNIQQTFRAPIGEICPSQKTKTKKVMIVYNAIINETRSVTGFKSM